MNRKEKHLVAVGLLIILVVLLGVLLYLNKQVSPPEQPPAVSPLGIELAAEARGAVVGEGAATGSTPDFTYTIDTTNPLQVHFTFTATGPVDNFLWNFDDGSIAFTPNSMEGICQFWKSVSGVTPPGSPPPDIPPPVINTSTTGTCNNPIHTYAQPGNYTVKLKVCDANANSNCDVITKTITLSTPSLPVVRKKGIPQDYVAYWNFDNVFKRTTDDVLVFVDATNTYEAEIKNIAQGTALSGGAIVSSLPPSGGTTPPPLPPRWSAFIFNSLLEYAGYAYLFQDGRFGNAPEFNGVDDVFNVLGSGNLDFTTTGFTVGAWIYPKASSVRPIISKENEWSFAVVDGTLQWKIGKTEWHDTLYPVPLRQWTHVALSYEPPAVGGTQGTVKVYAHGALVSSRPASPLPAVNSFVITIGGSSEGAFAGLLDELYIYHRLLSASEILALSENLAEPLNYISRWDFEEADSFTAKDSSGKYKGQLQPKTDGTWTRTPVHAGEGSSYKALRLTGKENEYVEINKTTIQNTPGSDATTEGCPSSSTCVLGDMLPEQLQITGALTVSAWVNVTGEGSQVIASTLSSSSSRNLFGWVFFINKEGQLLFLVGFGDNTPAIAATDFSDFANQWTQVTAVFEPSVGSTPGKICLYINGGKEKKCETTTLAEIDYQEDITPLRIGARADVPLNQEAQANFQGDLDDIRIYADALSPEEIKAVYLNGHSAPCFNQYCPSQAEVELLEDVDSSSSPIVKAKNILQSITVNDETVNLLTGYSVATAYDLYGSQQPSFRALGPVTAPQDLLYFTYAGKHYLTSLTAQDQWLVTASLNVKHLTGTELGSAELSTANQRPLSFPPSQTPLDLDSAHEGPEAYLQTLGYFDQLKRLGILTGVSPFMDFDQNAGWTITLVSEQPQNFRLAGVREEDRSISLKILPDGKAVLFLGGTEYGDLAVGAEPIKHFFNELHTVGVTVTLLALQDDFAVLRIEHLPVGLDEVYEKTITKTVPVTLENKILRICSNDPPLLAAVTVCESGKELFDLLDGMPKMLEDFSNILFFYQKPDALENKAVSAFHVFEFNEEPTELSTFFAFNLRDNRRMALTVDGQWYLLSKNEGAETADLTNLKLTRISGNKPGSASPEYLPDPDGDQFRAKFNLPLKRQINIKLIDEPNLRHQITQTSSAVPEVVNLVNQLQASVSTYGATTLLDAGGISALGTLAIDDKDLSIFQNKMKITAGRTPLELTWNVTAVPNVIINDGFNRGKALLHYQSFTPGGTPEEPQFTKYASLYLLYDLNEGKKIHEFSDPNFIQPIWRGKSLALGVDKQYYLLSYAEPAIDAVNHGFAFELLRLKRFDGSIILPQVADTVVTFPITEQKSIKATFDNTARGKVTFEILSTEAAAKDVAERIDLMAEVQATLTSYAPVTLLNSDLATLSIHPEDINSLQPVMRIKSSDGEDKRLALHVPVSWGTLNAPRESAGKALIIYDDFIPSGSGFQKTAELFLLYDLDEGTKTRAFTQRDFIAPLLAGKKLALKSFGSYYFLSHSGTGFQYNQLKLQGLDGVQQSKEALADNQIAFKVTGGKMVLSFDDLARTVTFSTVQDAAAKEEPLRFIPERDYQTKLPGFSVRPGVDNVLHAGSLEYYNCDSAATKEFTESFFLCVTGQETRRISKDKPTVDMVDDGHILIWYKGMTGGKKEVLLYTVLGAADETLDVDIDWEMLTKNLTARKSPVIDISGTFYQLSGSASLSSFALEEIPAASSGQAGQKFPVRVTSTSEGEQEAYAIVHGKLLQFKQRLEERAIKLHMGLLPYLVATPEGFITRRAEFISSPGQDPVTITAEIEGSFMRITLSNAEGEFFLARVPPRESRRVLLPSGEAITVTVPADFATAEGVTVKTYGENIE